jgi:glycosyltransferase involved in cell wall biosynthesis
MKSVLVIPPYPFDPSKIKIRIIEFAKLLSVRYRVYLLLWHVASEDNLYSRFLSCISDFLKFKKEYRSGSLTVVELPILHRPFFLTACFNSYFLKRFIKQRHIDVVLNGSYYMFDIPEKREFKYVLDLADVPVQLGKEGFDRFVMERMSREAEKADGVTAVSEGLTQYVWEKYGRKAEVVPNGAYIEDLRSIDKSAVADIRNKYGLKDKWVIGYIGFIGSWVEIEFLVNVLSEVKKEIPNAALFLVGHSPRLKILRKKFSSSDVIITGAIEGNINGYFHCLDLGVLAHKKNLVQDLAFHIKLIEYTAARKIVVATPLDEIKRLAFPNILLADLNIPSWVEAIKKAKNILWDEQWDNLTESYHWHKIADKLNGIIES